MVLRRRQKRRYISIAGAYEIDKLREAFLARYSELFGVVATAQASIKFISDNQGNLILRCSLGSTQNILVAIALLNPPVLATGMSGTLRGLRSQIAYSQRSWKAIDR